MIDHQKAMNQTTKMQDITADLPICNQLGTVITTKCIKPFSDGLTCKGSSKPFREELQTAMSTTRMDRLFLEQKAEIIHFRSVCHERLGEQACIGQVAYNPTIERRSIARLSKGRLG
jgi:hypothetical protein